ncbi:hypothetical protein PHLCEN_2v739 [Hermanssonia centrifuga]|uniref:Uncharacterized protein n=1 Tax=Hermanssonia centrifuga TaxID=98765 RepID=A0A2R6S5A7_9APHY|nr:hypothetical protein PHLCEN_2v739 [Hermanssonia centrifuga]
MHLALTSFSAFVITASLYGHLVVASDAHSGGGKRDGRKRHHAISYQEPNGNHSFSKRMDNVVFSLYDVTAGEVACGGFYQNSDFVVALNSFQYDAAGGSDCGKTISINYGGKTTQATIVDRCGSGCPYGGLDLTPTLFAYLAGSTAPGLINGGWDLGEPAPPPPTPSPTIAPPPPPPTSTSHTHTSSSPPPPPPPSSSSKPPSSSSAPSKTSSQLSSSSSFSSSSSSSLPSSSATPASTSSSEAPLATVQSTIDDFLSAYVQICAANAAAVQQASSA